MADQKLPYNTLIHVLNIKLSSSNFMLWKTQVTHILRAQKLFGFLDGSKPCPPAPVSLPVASNPPTAVEAAAKLAFDAAELVFEDWVAEDQRLCGLLFSSLSEEAMSEVIGCSTSQQIWETLFSVFQNRSRSSILQLWDQVLNLRRTGVSQEKIASCGLGAVQILSTGVATWLMDKAGRRILLIVSSIGVTISLTIVSAAFFIEEAISEDSNLYGVMGYLAVAGVVAMVACFSIGLGPIPWLIMSEILPVNIKGFGGSTATMAYFLMSWLVTLTANSLLDWSEGGTFAIYTGFAILVGIFVAMLLPETRGKSLEEIQLSFS